MIEVDRVLCQVKHAHHGGHPLAGTCVAGRVQGKHRESSETERFLLRPRLHPLLIELGDVISRELFAKGNGDQPGIAVHRDCSIGEVPIFRPENEKGCPGDCGTHLSRQSASGAPARGLTRNRMVLKRDSAPLKRDNWRDRTALHVD
jgi:hypothetical protein